MSGLLTLKYWYRPEQYRWFLVRIAWCIAHPFQTNIDFSIAYIFLNEKFSVHSTNTLLLPLLAVWMLSTTMPEYSGNITKDKRKYAIVIFAIYQCHLNLNYCFCANQFSTWYSLLPTSQYSWQRKELIFLYYK